ncbi:MAG: restriction endonuclease subunit S [Methylococcales bacterium]|nr:MAG: restriction endonuclease subunit S [Methylococcales bacterium]
MSIEPLITQHLDIWTAADTEKKSGRGRSSGSAGGVYGIKKLRELILELAVRGKLVPQDASDEPASELLKRIATEKAKLVAEGKIKKSKPLESITEEDKPYALPQGWQWARIIQLFQVTSGGSFDISAEMDSGEYIYLKVGDMNTSENETVITTSSRFVNPNIKERNGIIPANSIIFPKRGGAIATNKKRLVTSEIFVDLNIMAITVPRSISLIYTFQWLGGVDLAQLNTGTSVPQINHKDIEPLIFPLPPLAEQHRIVAKVDELMALCDQLENQHNNAAEAHEKLVTHLLGTLTQTQNTEDFNTHWQRISEYFNTLFTTEASIDALKQTLLQLAVMGKLVPQDPNDEPVSELLKRIQAEKAKLVAEGKIKKDKPLAEITEEEKPFDLPVGWEWVLFEQILSYKQGLQVGTENQFLKKETGATRYLRITDFRNDDEIRYIKDSSQDVYCNEIDLLMIRYGGTAGEIVSGKKGIYHNNMFRIDYDQKLLDRKYLWNYLALPSIRNELDGGSTSSTMPQISHKVMNKIKLPLAPIEEQQRIVTKVDELMAICDQLKSCLTEANQLQQKLADVVIMQVI